MQKTTKTAEELKQLAQEYTQKLPPGYIVVLSGPLGAGKTTFVQGAAASLGIKDPIPSPTFTYMNIYDLPKTVRGIKKLVHVDLYRLTPHQAEAKGILDYLGDPDAVTFIEWGEKLEKWLRGQKAKKIIIELEQSGHRTVEKQES